MQKKYRQRISGPLLDRIDLHVEVSTVDYKLHLTEEVESSDSIRQRVENARHTQRERFQKERGIHTNNAMTPRLIRNIAKSTLKAQVP